MRTFLSFIRRTPLCEQDPKSLLAMSPRRRMHMGLLPHQGANGGPSAYDYQAPPEPDHYPRLHPKLGTLPPFPEKVAAAITAKDKSHFQPSGAYAANLLGLTEQVPAKIVFLTEGTNRTVTIGRTKISFKKATAKNMATAGRISGPLYVPFLRESVGRLRVGRIT